MEKKSDAPKTVDEYISAFPPEVRTRLEKLRKLIKKTVPGVEERISYRMPAYYLGGYLVFFAAYPRHIGFYALPGAMAAFKERLGPYKKAKGSVQFPIDEEPPYDLIRDMLVFRVKENEERAAAKKKAVPKKRSG
jgi:uncharacterized protein YdhG (YjbR/CyaY superfamily)